MLVMGILNVTPDSFADGGKHFTFEHAVSRGLEMIEEGVDIIDIGGESTRPGAERVSESEEQARILPVIAELTNRGVDISVDTMRATTAKLAVAAGASIVNDVSGGVADDLMHEVVAEMGCPYILMHWRGHSKYMNNKAVYGDVVKEVIAELNIQIEAALRSGIAKNNLIIDPGLGFAKDGQHNWEILNRIDELIMFMPLTQENVRQIVTIQLNNLKVLLRTKDIKLVVTPEAFDWISEAGYDPFFGARPVKRVIQKQVLNELSKALLAGTVQTDSTIVMDVFDGKIIFRKPIHEKEELV
jgi:dihydropteroate synthase